MTPIKTIILFGTMVLVEDTAGGIDLKATAPNERDAEWLASSLATFHGVPLERTQHAGQILMRIAAK